jgi:F-type H+-transporting ATPase subunit gamma
MPSLREVRRRIRSTQSTQKITKAMQVVSATKLRGAQDAVRRARPYADKINDVLATTAQRATHFQHPYLIRREGDRALVIVITADQGLAGAVNSNTLRAVNHHINLNHRGQAQYVAIGRKGESYLARFRRQIVASVTGIPDHSGLAPILPAVRAALTAYDQDEVDTVLLAYAKFISTLRHEPTVRTLLPIQIPERDPGQGLLADYEYEPDAADVLDALLPRWVETEVYEALLENQASFHSARMIAMQNATNAADDMITDLTLTANKVRQAAITTELMEIVSGAEALRQ